MRFLEENILLTQTLHHNGGLKWPRFSFIYWFYYKAFTGLGEPVLVKFQYSERCIQMIE